MLSGNYESKPYDGGPVPLPARLPKLVGLCGKMHAGKSTVSEVLEKKGWRVAYFAGPVKHIATMLTNTLYYEVGRNLGVKWEPKTAADLEAEKDRFRTLYQFVGGYGRHAFGDDTWVRMFEEVHARDGEYTGPLVVADLRYPNEAKYLLDKGFRVFLVKRNEDDRRRSVADSFFGKNGRKIKKKELKAILAHGSETGVDDIETRRLYTDIIENDGDIHELRTLAGRLA